MDDQCRALVANPADNNYYVLWAYEEEIIASGPLLSLREAKVWAHGFKIAIEGTDYKYLGIVTNVIDNNVTLESIDIT